MTTEAGDTQHGLSEAASYGVVAIAASAGGLQALIMVIGNLPQDFPVPVLVVQHLDPRHDTVLAEILGRRTRLSVKLAEHGELAKPGVVYIAPPGRHLLVGDSGRLALTVSELVHFVRPSADLLFESVASSYGASSIACVLTGSGTDGAMGVSAVKARGGTVLVQDPAKSDFRGMPEAAVATGAADFILGLDEIAQVIVGLVSAGRHE
jgi:two-component system chemotaxis response regulator CheB